MANINDYLSWRGDLVIDDKNRFNEIDSMILARFSYLIFNKIKMDEIETIKSISNKMKMFKNQDFRFNGDKELITKLGMSDRFKSMKITDFVENNNLENEKQFGAITIHISDKEMYISFIGTDSTLCGWKEDFNMSFMDLVPCQEDGKEYLRKIAEKYINKKIRVGGHSKGGNVAIYSAIMSSKEIKDRIIKVYNYDGPGFSNKVIEKLDNKEILEKIQTYIPQDSIIGRLMEHIEKCEVVKSVEKGIMQHDIYSWQVLKDDMINLKNVTENSEVINKAITDWLKNTSEEQRKVFIDTIFDLLYSTNVSTFGEIYQNLLVNIKLIFKKYKNISEEDKKIITEMVKIFIKDYYNVVKSVQTDKFESIKEEYMNKGKKLIRKI